MMDEQRVEHRTGMPPPDLAQEAWSRATIEPFEQLSQEAWDLWRDLAKQNDQKLATGYNVHRVTDAPEYGQAMMAAFAQWCQNKQTMAYDRARHRNEADPPPPAPNVKSLPEVYAIEVVARTSHRLGCAEATLDLIAAHVSVAGRGDESEKWPPVLEALAIGLEAYREMRDADAG